MEWQLAYDINGIVNELSEDSLERLDWRSVQLPLTVQKVVVQNSKTERPEPGLSENYATAYRNITDEAYNQFPYRKMALNNTEGDWSKYNREVNNLLKPEIFIEL